MQDNPKHIVIKYLLFTEVWKSKNIWFLLCTQNGAEGLREKGGVSTVTCINLLKTKRTLLYLRNKTVPRSKHLPSQL